MDSTFPKRPRHQPEITDNLGKLPPRDTDLEEAVLGALMLEKDAYMNVCELLTPESFYEPRNQKIYEAIASLGIKQQPIDMLTVTEELRRIGTLEEVGGPVRITELTAGVYSAANVEFHAKIVGQKHLARRLISFATKVESESFDESRDIDEVMQEAEKELFNISQTQLKREVTQVDPVLNAVMEQIQAAANRETGLSGLQSGYRELDRLTSGWQDSDLIIIAARPAMGKTAFVLSMAKNMAVDFNIPIAIFTLEMTNDQLVKRIISNVADLEGEKIKSGRLSTEEWDRLNTRLRSIYGAPLYLDETPALTITELRTKARRLVREKNVRMIMIDYLQLMNAGKETGKFGSREQEVSTISRSLKALAKELNIPIIALSQLNRSTTTREDKRPMLSDLRESGAIEQDADIVCFIHRPAYYTKSKEDENGNDISDLAEFIVAKHRSGAVDTIDMTFVSRFARFEDRDRGFNAVRDAIGSATTMHVASEWNSSDPDSEQQTTGLPDLTPAPGEENIPF